ncbi:MAG TPA: ribulose-phosphate 3-epimerase [Anaerolineales bacterium]|nr:ribulose-phosphate 3-epimerase [Anaerolineales bacterium]
MSEPETWTENGSRTETSVIIEPSILASDYARLGEQVQEAEAAGVEAIQIDVMDGQFVPNITFGWGIVRALRPLVGLTLDAHLMIVQPERYLAEFAQAGADRIIVHQETCPNLPDTLQAIRRLGVEAGIAISPGTPLQALEGALELADLVQVMTVNPGFGGQAFIHSQLEVIRELRQVLERRGLGIPIAVDGGVNLETAPLVVGAGASVLVAGSSVYNRQASVAANLRALYASIGAG